MYDESQTIPSQPEEQPKDFKRMYEEHERFLCEKAKQSILCV